MTRIYKYVSLEANRGKGFEAAWTVTFQGMRRWPEKCMVNENHLAKFVMSI